MNNYRVNELQELIDKGEIEKASQLSIDMFNEVLEYHINFYDSINVKINDNVHLYFIGENYNE